MAKMNKFRVLDGKHHTTDAAGNEYTYHKNDIIESDKPLDTIFLNKFERVGGPAPTLKDGVTDPQSRLAGDSLAKAQAKKEAATTEDDDTAEESTAKAPSAKEPEVVSSKLGDDVTDTFPEAEEAGFKVFKGKGGWYVAETEDLDKALNAKALKKTEVAAFIESKK